jgi:hypothetical protein
MFKKNNYYKGYAAMIKKVSRVDQVTCSTPKQGGCSGGKWKKLLSLGVGSQGDCELACKAQGSNGCCWYSKVKDGCYFKLDNKNIKISAFSKYTTQVSMCTITTDFTFKGCYVDTGAKRVFPNLRFSG